MSEFLFGSLARDTLHTNNSLYTTPGDWGNGFHFAIRFSVRSGSIYLLYYSSLLSSLSSLLWCGSWLDVRSVAMCVCVWMLMLIVYYLITVYYKCIGYD